MESDLRRTPSQITASQGRWVIGQKADSMSVRELNVDTAIDVIVDSKGASRADRC